jgi:hypothetical protein
MGENVLKDQVKKFRKGMDRSVDAAGAKSLFSVPAIVSAIYTATPVNGCPLAAGDRVTAVADAEHGVAVAKGHLVTARILEGDGTAELIEVLKRLDSPGAAAMVVTEVGEISGCYKLRIAEDGEG